ncbi:MAG: DUF4859 domain-containing protein [Bacteroidaceae bacterium]|nr:DUF4859 domain-containing protein [Bacteroidaceae bacterium]
MKHLLLTALAAMALPLLSQAGTKTTYHVNVTRDAARDTETPSVVRASVNALAEAFNRSSEEAFAKGLAAGTIKFVAKQGTTNTVYNTSTYGTYGHWFTARSIACAATNKNRCIASKYDTGYFYITHNPDKAQQGTAYQFTQMFIQDTDTVAYEFTVTLGTRETAESDQPAYQETINHRPDILDRWPVTPLMKQNDQAYLRQNYLQVSEGDNVTFFAEYDTAAYKSIMLKVADRTGKTVRSYRKDPVTLSAVQPSDAGYYTVTVRLTGKDNKLTLHDCLYFLDVLQQPLGSPFTWEGKVPQFSHDWKSDAKFNYGVYERPTKNLGDVPDTDRNGRPVNRVDGEWWTCVWGSDLNKEVGAYNSAEVRKAAENMMKKYDTDFAYIRDQMGWPPDLRARNGYRSLVYVFGSGLRNDGTDPSEKGGYQSAIWYSDPATGISANWPCVWASYYPFSRFRDDADQKWSDGDYQREAMVHEGIHAIFADLGTCHRSSWFHEAGNVWLQSAMNSERDSVYGLPGFLDACPFIAPFMPIECYSGWLQDGSFGGPQAEGVNMYNSNGQQICTWRNLLGGTQYGNAFPIILGEICGKGSIPWIWRNCEDYVLKGIGRLLGEETMRQLILQYRARQTTFDIGGWKSGYRDITNSDMGLVVKPEWEPYWIDVEPYKLSPYQGMAKNDSLGWLAPDSLTTPGWSGANLIPIHVDSKASTATVEFRPEDTEMRAQLCYVTKDGTCHYSQPAHCGKLQIDITDRPANEVIFFVVCNTDYIFKNDEVQRKHHWDYRLRLLGGALAVADKFCRWYYNEQTITDPNYNEDIARANKGEEEEEVVSLTDITSLIDRYLNAEAGVTIQTITALIDKYLSQGTTTGKNTAEAAPSFRSAAVPGSNGVKLITGNPQAGHPIKVQLASGIAPEDVRVNILGLSGIIANEAPLQGGNTYTLPANLVPGVYFVKFTQKGLTDTYKIFIK